MIELTGDPKRDGEIIGFSHRKWNWYSIVDDLKAIVTSSKERSVSDPDELRLMEEAQEWFQKINVAK
jgi:hypothetical protein